MKDVLYREIADGINQTVGRKAVSVEQLKKIVDEGKYIRQSQGSMALYQFAQEIPYRFLTEREAEKLKNSPNFSDLSTKTIELLLLERVITPFEARMMRRYI
ncbi:hypothetical protein [Thermoflavimicrobium daqui]|uniref:Uncharacterized protein n=1 Tax=Thermoflavimicrobium daqui TaxID=2137476 RepID=A0A364K756_9BACL|nr:hypothetical protein [Thermoflavimicrobium daqui]RAL26136.1 hypothetical protein DL897_03815 [Thermoflavimicrobium daqui]